MCLTLFCENTRFCLKGNFCCGCSLFYTKKIIFIKADNLLWHTKSTLPSNNNTIISTVF